MKIEDIEDKTLVVRGKFFQPQWTTHDGINGEGYHDEDIKDSLAVLHRRKKYVSPKDRSHYIKVTEINIYAVELHEDDTTPVGGK